MKKNTRFSHLACTLVLAAFTMLSVPAQAEEKAVNNGTDPTLLATTAVIQYTTTDLAIGESVGLFELEYTTPINEQGTMSLKGTLPYASGVIDDDYAIGDASVKFTHVTSLNASRGLAYTAEFFFDTAERDELGTGQTVLELNFFYVKFLESGAIFAPAILQRFDLTNNKNRRDVNSTTIDLYYVPKLSNPKYYITYDPAFIADHENDLNYLSLTVTFGRLLGKVFGGDSQVYIKPQILVGGDRPADWSFLLGYKVIGF